MHFLIRIVVTATTAIGTFFFTFLIGGAWLRTDGNDWALWLIATVFTVAAGGLVWTCSQTRGGFFSTVSFGAVATGAIAFCAGFFLPMLLAPQSGQGPLLGILIAGPAFLFGGVGGGLYWTIRRVWSDK
jgi:hypothetical protein